ncbi:MAG: thermonuclease family protein [Bacilli bacterium]
MKKRHRTKITGFGVMIPYMIVMMLVILSINPALTFLKDFLKPIQSLESNRVYLTKCTDGDTAHFKINGKDEVVRFLAIDTPETLKPNTPVQPYGKEASNYTCEIISNAKNIELQYETGNETDKYGRKLAWVFTDGKLLQKDLISKGYAKVAYEKDTYKYTAILKNVELEAKMKKIGIWSE